MAFYFRVIKWDVIEWSAWLCYNLEKDGAPVGIQLYQAFAYLRDFTKNHIKYEQWSFQW